MSSMEGDSIQTFVYIQIHDISVNDFCGATPFLKGLSAGNGVSRRIFLKIPDPKDLYPSPLVPYLDEFGVFLHRLS